MRKVTLTRYRMIITSVWWGGGLAIILAFIWVTLDDSNFGAFGSQALDWLLPHILPTMTLTGAVAYSRPAETDGPVTKQIRFAFALACLISVFYLLLLLLITGFTLMGTGVESQRGIIDSLLKWNKLLGVLQGLAASAIGVFFVKH